MNYPKTKQEIFDVVMIGLWKQNRQSLGGDKIKSQCAYRSESGDKCAIGMLIPNSIYRNYFEDNDVFSLRRLIIDDRGTQELQPFGKFLNTHIEFLSYLQSLHDGYSRSFINSPTMFRDYLIREGKIFAGTHNLTLNIPPKE